MLHYCRKLSTEIDYNFFSSLTTLNQKLPYRYKMGFTSDGLGPKKTGRAGLASGPGLSPSLKPGPRAGPGQAGLLGSAFNQFTLKNINFLQNVCKLNT